MSTTTNDLDYYSMHSNGKITLSPKERRVLEYVKENPKSQSGQIKEMLRKEGWERYDEEMEGKVHTWPHLELAKKGLIYSHNQGTARYWVLTLPGTQLLKDLDEINKVHSNNYNSAQEALQSFASPTEMIQGILTLAHIFLKSKTDAELEAKIEKLKTEYNIPENVALIVGNAERTNESGIVRVANV